jgi:hypothetical protein
MSKGKIQEIYQTSDDDSRIPRQARLDSNYRTSKPTLESEKREEMKRPPIRGDLKVSLYQSQEADNTFITSDGTSPYNSTR